MELSTEVVLTIPPNPEARRDLTNKQPIAVLQTFQEQGKGIKNKLNTSLLKTRSDKKFRTKIVH